MKKGFATPILIFIILLPIIILLAYAPWVTNEYAHQKAVSTITKTCEEYDIRGTKYGFDFKSSFPADAYQFSYKTIKNYFDFGNKTTVYVMCETDNIPKQEVFFVSSMGTVHKLSSVDAPVINTSIGNIENTGDETANPDLIGANWKTYTNQEFKFSLNYPRNPTDFVVYVSKVDAKLGRTIPFIKEPASFNIFIYEAKSGEDVTGVVDQALEWLYKTPYIEKYDAERTDIKVDSENGERLVLQRQIQLSGYIMAVIIKNNRIYQFVGGNYEVENKQNVLLTFDQILSTFKFLD